MLFNRFILFLFIVFILLAFLAQGVESREMSLEAEGDISIHSVSGNSKTKTASSVEGNGYINYNSGSEISSTSVVQGYSMELKSGDNTKTPLTGIVSTRVLNGNGAVYYYALKIIPNPGTVAILDIHYSSSNIAFASLDIESKVYVEKGIFRNYIDISNEESDLSIYEEIFVKGYANFWDIISIADPNTSSVE